MHLIKHTHSHSELIADEFLFYALSQKELKKYKIKAKAQKKTHCESSKINDALHTQLTGGG